MVTKNLATANIVVVANAFNISIFNQIWFVKHELFTEEEVTSSEVMFMPMVTQIETNNCHLLVVPERMQMTFKNPQEDSSPLDKVCKMISLLPQTPYTALGLNVTWELSFSDETEIGEFTKTNFALPDHPFYKRFFSTNSRFGTYASMDYDDFRLKLDVKPVRIMPNKIEKVHFNFNFHLDLVDSEEKANSITSHLEKWNQAFAETGNMVTIFTSGK